MREKRKTDRERQKLTDREKDEVRQRKQEWIIRERNWKDKEREQ